MRGRAVVRFLIVLIAVASMLLAPVVTWPSSGHTAAPGSSTEPLVAAGRTTPS